MLCDFKSNIKLKSNIITKDKWVYNHDQYLPFNLLPEIYRDPSLKWTLTAQQKKRSEELLFHCKKKREVKERIWNQYKCYENCNECSFHDICF